MRSVTSLLAAALVAGFPDEPTRKAFEDHRFSNSYTLPAGTGHWLGRVLRRQP